MKKLSPAEISSSKYLGQSALVIDGDGENTYFVEIDAFNKVTGATTKRHVFFFCNNEDECKKKIEWFTDGNLDDMSEAFRIEMTKHFGSWDKAKEAGNRVKCYGKIIGIMKGIGMETFKRNFAKNFFGRVEG